MTRTRNFRRLLVLLVGAVLATATPFAPASSSAATVTVDAIALSGNYGVFEPGLTLVPAAQTFQWDANADDPTNPAIVDCHGNGNDVDGSYATGGGTMTITCGPIALNVCAFIRVGLVMPFVCVDTTVQGATGVLTLIPLQFPPSPIVQFNVVGAMTYVAA